MCDRIAQRMAAYAAKVAAETVRAEPPAPVDLSDGALMARLANCGRPPRTEELPAIRAAFLAEYGRERSAVERLAAVREYVDDPGNWSVLDGRRQMLLILIDGLPYAESTNGGAA